MSSENSQVEKRNKKEEFPVIKIRRCATVVKGGRRFSFAAMVIVGDGAGRVTWGSGKAKEVAPAVKKAQEDGKRRLKTIRSIFPESLRSSVVSSDYNSDKSVTIPHEVIGRYGAARVVLVPAQPGTGVIAGAAVRAVCEACGISDILTKSYGSNNPINLVKATIDALHNTRQKEEVERLRGVKL